ncbi:hypothetical protein [Flavobacterium sp.]|uniref:hypothetical protein n=1 Tax=Flavobacterium sp. TaxID=239 RepID=UPI00261AE277|nr:hypothetical protein [Flavobacterium sp.]
MARINAKGLLSGSVGPVAFRVVNGKAIAASKPGKGNVKQTTATKQSASEFGMALAAAKKIRMGLSDVFGAYADAGMHRRFGTKIYEVLRSCHSKPAGTRTIADGDLNLLQGFDFNSNSPFGQHCLLQPDITMTEAGAIHIALPPTIGWEAFPQKGKAAGGDLCIEVVAFDPVHWTIATRSAFVSAVAFDGTDTAASQHTTPPLEKGLLVFVTATLVYKRHHAALGTLTLNHKSLHPSAVLAVFLTAAAPA